MQVTIIIPVRDASCAPRCLSTLRDSKFPSEKIEIIIVAGNSPSAQRNLAVRQASGEILYFIDDDSMLDPRAIQRLVEAFVDHPQIAGVGGPSLGITTGTLFQKCATMAMGSLFGFGPARHRYYPTGCPRIGSENELILSNFAVRKNIWEQCEGFDTRLYPNEENEFIRRLENKGHQFLYHPGVIVMRPARTNVQELAKQVFCYGMSRAKHMRIASSALNLFLLLPTLMVIYLFLAGLVTATTTLALVTGAFTIATFSQSQFPLLPFVFVMILAASPLMLYGALTFGASLYAALSVGKRRMATFFWHLLIFPTIHLGYGAGWIRGCFAPIQILQPSHLHIHHICLLPASI